jgi:hypothetical protein
MNEIMKLRYRSYRRQGGVFYLFVHLSRQRKSSAA